MMKTVRSVLQQVKNADNEYEVTLPYNTMDEVLESLESGKTLRQVNIEINDKQEGLLDDLGTIMYSLSGLIDDRLQLNQIYRENFKTNENIDITTGVYTQGCVKSVENQGIDFRLRTPVTLNMKPSKFKLKHFINIKNSRNTAIYTNTAYGKNQELRINYIVQKKRISSPYKSS